MGQGVPAQRKRSGAPMEAHAVPLPVSDKLLAVTRRGRVVDAVALGCVAADAAFAVPICIRWALKTMSLPAELEQGRVG